MKTIRSNWGAALLPLMLLAACGRPAPEPAAKPAAKPATKPAAPAEKRLVSTPQGWSDSAREAAWFSTFGSQLMPYRWLAALELPGSTERFASEQNMVELGFLPAPTSDHNPGAYPVGFTRSKDAKGQFWVGLGCAACHTGEIHYGDVKYRIDGAPGLIDFTAFEAGVIRSLSATLADPAKFDRFARTLGADQGKARQDLQNQMVSIAQSLDALHRINESELDYGHGRLDAFGQIFNAVAVNGIGLPENAREPNAPVSFPALWSASHLDLVQWNGSAPNAGPGPLLQNVTTALAVYGSVDLRKKAGLGYDSSVDFAELGALQDRYYQLKSPQWPAAFGAIDAAKAGRGAALYAQQCQSCHALSMRDDGKRQLKTVMVDVDDIGTDPRMARNFLAGKVKTGMLKGRKQAVLAGPVFGNEARSIDVVVHAAIGATLRHPLSAAKDAIGSYHKTIKAGIDQHPDHYKARPLDGIWASAPYLHNGSVPTLADLLLPEAQRPARFVVGNRMFDPQRVGYVSDGEGPGRFVFDTTLTGNRNTGHLYGTALDAAQRADLLEYLKSL